MTARIAPMTEAMPLAAQARGMVLGSIRERATGKGNPIKKKRGIAQRAERNGVLKRRDKIIHERREIKTIFGFPAAAEKLPNPDKQRSDAKRIANPWVGFPNKKTAFWRKAISTNMKARPMVKK